MKVQVLTESENSLSRGKKFYVGLFDFLSMFLICAILFVGFLAVFRSTDAYVGMQDDIDTSKKVLADLCVESGLTKYITADGGQSLASMERIAVDCVKGQVLARFTADGDERSSDGIFDGITPLTAENDPCLQYLNAYRTAHIAEYANADTSLDADFCLETMRNTDCFGTEKYPILTTESASAIYTYLTDETASDEIYATVKNAYLTVVKECINDFMDGNSAYAEKQENYADANEKLYRVYLYGLLVAYLLAMITVYLILPLVLKEGRTAFMKLFRLRSLNTFDGGDITNGQTVIRFVCQLFLNLFAPLLVLLISQDISTFAEIIFVKILHFFNFFTVGTLALILTFCNMIFTLYSRRKKQTITEFVSGMTTVEDKRVKNVNLGGIDVELK